MNNCSSNAVCSSTGPALYACVCDTGFVGDGFQCNGMDPPGFLLLLLRVGVDMKKFPLFQQPSTVAWMERTLVPPWVDSASTRDLVSITAPVLLAMSAQATRARVPFLSLFSPCRFSRISVIACECNGHSAICDPATTDCGSCTGNTMGNHCERCLQGYYRTGNLTDNCQG